MAYTYLNNMQLEEALALYKKEIEKAGIAPRAEEISVTEALGRVTSQAVYAHISSPHYNACAMDGIAVCAQSTFGATDTTPVILKSGVDFVRVDTGDPLPGSFDAVVMIEDVIELEDGTVQLITAATPWQHVRQIGEDLCAGEMVLPSSIRIDAASIGALLAGGVQRIKVWKRPVVGIIPTGDEIVPPTCNPKKGEIIEFNSSIFSSMLTGWNAVPRVYPIVPDIFDQLLEAVKTASSECDIVIVNAGSSAGSEDYSARVIEAAGTMLSHGISIRPGKPTILGIVSGCPVIGVPGYPVSGIIVMEEIVKTVVAYLEGSPLPHRPSTQAVLSRRLVSSLKYREFVRVKLGQVGRRLVATPLNRGAGVVTSFVKADGILEIPLDCEGLDIGENVEVRLLRSLEEISRTLVVTGSHDPLIDTVNDILRRRYPGEAVSSSHVGSLGGLMAIKRSEAHIAGTHLLDVETGEYNKSYIRKYLGSMKAVQICGVQRIQGIMTAVGNPLKLETLSDLSRPGLSYVNRQKGSGTRVLLDYLLDKNNISPASIYGYAREEFTHMSVAALIASGSADAGIGILSAAKIYNLSFIPLCEEQYDFVIPEAFMNMDLVQHFLEILKSEEFRQALNEMGGYKVEGTGEVI